MKNPAKITGWVLSVLLFLFLGVASASGKFIDFPGKAEMFEKMGWKTDVMMAIGVVEVACAVLFLIPRTAFIGAILLTAYLGGATCVHVRVGENFAIPIVLGIIMWVALGLRDRRVFQVAFKPNEQPAAQS